MGVFFREMCMKYPAFLPYPGSCIRAAVVLGGLFVISLAVAAVARFLDSVFSVLTWINFLTGPVYSFLLMVVLGLFLWGMALLHQFWSDRPLKWIPHWRSWFGGVADCLTAILGSMIGLSFVSDQAPLWFGMALTFLGTSYVYYLFDLFEEGRQLAQFREGRQRAKNNAYRKEQNREHHRQSLPKMNRPMPNSKPHDPIDEELEELRRKLDEI